MKQWYDSPGVEDYDVFILPVQENVQRDLLWLQNSGITLALVESDVLNAVIHILL